MTLATPFPVMKKQNLNTIWEESPNMDTSRLTSIPASPFWWEFSFLLALVRDQNVSSLKVLDFSVQFKGSLDKSQVIKECLQFISYWSSLAQAQSRLTQQNIFGKRVTLALNLYTSICRKKITHWAGFPLFHWRSNLIWYENLSL